MDVCQATWCKIVILLKTIFGSEKGQGVWDGCQSGTQKIKIISLYRSFTLDS